MGKKKSIWTLSNFRSFSKNCKILHLEQKSSRYLLKSNCPERTCGHPGCQAEYEPTEAWHQQTTSWPSTRKKKARRKRNHTPFTLDGGARWAVSKSPMLFHKWLNQIMTKLTPFYRLINWSEEFCMWHTILFQKMQLCKFFSQSVPL